MRVFSGLDLRRLGRNYKILNYEIETLYLALVNMSSLCRNYKILNYEIETVMTRDLLQFGLMVGTIRYSIMRLKQVREYIDLCRFT